MTLPLLLSVPHAGLRVPEEVADNCLLTPQEIVEDGDEGAAEIYDLSSEVEACLTTDVARAIVDLNRPEGDLRRDGIVKTHTCWEIPVYHDPLSESMVTTLVDRYHRPYHARLSELAQTEGLSIGVDCHTMAVKGPPVGPDPGEERPWICLSNAEGTCPPEWIEALRESFAQQLEGPVTINDPFRGGYCIRRHSGEMPWIQIELSRGPFKTNAEKRQIVLNALRLWCRFLESTPG
jgi:N-formylglutamate deformylase